MNIAQDSHQLSLAPMMDRTDRHFRYFIRLISSNILLYTEMITTGALIHGDRKKYLKYDPIEHPVVLQLGGSNPKDLSSCSKMIEDEGYDEINLNVGCPSERVQANKFGACLMFEPNLVAECIHEMQSSVSIPVTVKCRTGVDDKDHYDDLYQFIETVNKASCDTFIIHARKAWLSGLSPKENREVPPLNYQTVHQIKQDFPNLNIEINGGFTELNEVVEQLQHVDGVMIGRALYHNPYLLAEADQLIYKTESKLKSRNQIMEQMLSYIEKELMVGTKLSNITRHILGLYHNQPHSRLFRRHLAENAYRDDADTAVLKTALGFVETVEPAEALVRI